VIHLGNTPSATAAVALGQPGPIRPPVMLPVRDAVAALYEQATRDGP
jgi:hypothetical protein